METTAGVRREEGLHPVLSVSTLTTQLRELVEARFDDVWVEGEVSNFRQYGSGHCYFTLKDEGAQLRAVLFRHFTPYVFFEPKDGLLVRAHGRLSVYAARGEVQLVARSLHLAGEGALQQAFEALHWRLAAEGLFDPAAKQPLPPLPRRIGVVTSRDGAALHDVLTVLGRRFPAVEVVLCPTSVQGLGAAASIAAAVAAFNALPPDDPRRPDVLIVGRGGGSLEDLWAFNEEAVVRALYASAIPVISAVGHETDVTLADLAADVRAATPSMAAELAVPDKAALKRSLETLARRGAELLARHIAERRQVVTLALRAYGLRRVPDRTRHARDMLQVLLGRLAQGAAHRDHSRRAALAALTGRLPALDPHRPLRQGYARVEHDGRAVRSSLALAPGHEVSLVFADGAQLARILEAGK